MIYLAFGFVLAIFVGIYARNQKRSGIGWFFASLLISPLISFIILLAVGEAKAEQAPIPESPSNPSNNFNKKQSPNNNPQNDNKVCSYCAETIKKSAVLCRYCGKEQLEPNNEYVSKISPNTGLPIIPSGVSGTPEGKLLDGILNKSWGKVNSAIMLGADLSISLNGSNVLELAKEYGDSPIVSLIEKHFSPIDKLSLDVAPKKLSDTISLEHIPHELKGKSEGKLLEGIFTNNWGKVNSALMLGADLTFTIEGKCLMDIAKSHSDNSIVALLERHIINT